MISRDKNKAYLTKWLDQVAGRDFKNVTFGSASIGVAKGVFDPSPKVTHSTQIIAKRLQNLEGKSVLDIGTGSGVLAIQAAKAGASRVCATDISAAAIECARMNIIDQGLLGTVKIEQADIFPAGSGERFDLIIANLPFVGPEKVVRRNLRLFAKKLEEKLAPGGAALIAWASFAECGLVDNVLSAHGFEFDRVTETRFGVEWYLYSASLEGKPDETDAESVAEFC